MASGKLLVNFYKVVTKHHSDPPSTEWRYSSGNGKPFIKVTVVYGSGFAEVERFLSKTERVDGVTVPLWELTTKLEEIDATWEV